MGETTREAGSNAEWRRWGEIDPHWGVASWSGKEAGSDDAWTDDEFYGLGERDWETFLAHWRRYGVEPGVVLEIGCGTGRLTRPMAGFFSHVHGVDVAPGMLEKAADAVRGLPVTLHATNGLELPLPDDSVDAVFSTHVFQHLDSEADADANWREIARVLAPGGSMMVHLPVGILPLGLERIEHVHRVRRRLGDLRAGLARRAMARGGRPIMRGNTYLWPRVSSRLRELGLVDVELAVFAMGSNDDEHAVVLARSPRHG